MRGPQAPNLLSPETERLFRALPRAGVPAAGEGRGHWVSGRAGSRAAGTEVVFYVCVERPDGAVTGARFQAFGCPHTLATAAWVAERLPGISAGSPPPWGARDWAAELGVPVNRLGRLLSIEDALNAAWRAARGALLENAAETYPQP
jgi:hypothetical protein